MFVTSSNTSTSLTTQELLQPISRYWAIDGRQAKDLHFP
jgi:hypothetical protein